MSNIDIMNLNPDTTRESYLFTDHPSTPNGDEGNAKWHINTLFHKGVENYRSQVATLSGVDNKMLYRNYRDGWSKWEEVGNGVITGDTSGSTGVNPDVEQELLEIRELILLLIEGGEGSPGLKDGVDDLVIQVNALIKRLDDLMINADFTTISAKDAYLDRIHGGSIDVINASIDTAKINLASINTLLAGNITAENIKTGAITAQSGVIANGAILNGMIVNLDVNKLLAGNISTNKFNIVSDSGNLSMKENTLKVWDTTGQERVSLGKNGADYNLLVRGLDGHTVLFGSDGVTKAGITEGAIDDSKVDVNANISGGKLNINSVVSHINAGTTSIESTHINLDGQKLNVAFSKLGTDFSNLLTDFTVEQGKISAIITDVDNTGQTVSTMKQDLSGFSQSLTSLQETTGELSTGLATATQDLTGFKTTVSESYYTKQEVEDKVQAGNVLYDAYILAQEELERIKFEAYKDGTITPAERQAITDALEVVRVAKEKYEESGEQVEYVGRNLVLLSDVDKSSTSNVLAEYTLSRKLIPGKYYTLTVNGFIGAGKLGYVAYLDNTNNLIGELVDVGGKNNTITFKAFSTVASVTKLIINTRGSGTSRSDIDWVKLEAGKSSTDWTVAPEDTAELITTATSSISQLSDAIDLKVSKDGVISAINLTPGTAKIKADKITLQGAVTVLSNITGNLGSITAGTINGTTISASTFTGTNSGMGTDSYYGSYSFNTAMALKYNELSFNESRYFSSRGVTGTGVVKYNEDGVSLEKELPSPYSTMGSASMKLDEDSLFFSRIDTHSADRKYTGGINFDSSMPENMPINSNSNQPIGIEAVGGIYLKNFTHVNGALTVFGDAQINRQLTCDGFTSYSTANINTTLNVFGSTLLRGNVNIGNGQYVSSLNVTGSINTPSLTGNNVYASNLTLGGNIMKSHIHDFGTRGGWEWIKFTDGLMICYIQMNMYISTSPGYAGMHRVNLNSVSYPVTFNSPPNVVATAPVSEIISFAVRTSTRTECSFRAYSEVAISLTATVGITATGRWKA